MARINIPCLVSKRTAGGVLSWYWQPSAALKRDGWKSIALGADADAAIKAAQAQNAKVAEWRQGGARPAAVRKLVRPLTVSDGIRRFREAGWPSVKHPGQFLAAGTRKTYDDRFKVIEAWAGDVPLAAIDAERVAVFRDALMKPAAGGRRKGEVRHTSAHATLRVGRSFFAWLEQQRLIPKGSNPFENFALSKPAPRDHIWWAPAREALLDAAEPDMAVAVDLAFQIGQREADLLKLGLGQYVEIPAFKIEDVETYQLLLSIPVPPLGERPGYQPADVRGIRLRQSKGKRWVEVPIVGATRARVEAAIARAKAAGCTTILLDERPAARGERAVPWTAPNPASGQDRFIKRFAALRAAAIARLREGDGGEAAAELAAEIETLQFRDFRRTAVVWLGELGIPDHLIAAITGHDLDETKRILDTYMPRTTGMAARAIAMSLSRQSGTLARAEEGKAG